jgi:hypothetical protein
MAFLSADDGRTWSGGLLLDQREGVSYPDAAQGADGTIYVIYDYDRRGAREILMARFSEEDIRQRTFVSAVAERRMLVNKASGGKPTV